MPSRSPAGDDRGSVPARWGSEQGVCQRRFSPVGEREPTRGSPTGMGLGPYLRKGGFHALPVARRRRSRCRSTALGFATRWSATWDLACGRAGAHKRLPYGD
jgi:hypothetical protein